MIRNFADLISLAKRCGPARIAVACANDREVLIAVHAARGLGIAEAILVGNREEILRAGSRASVPVSDSSIIDIPDPAAASRAAVEIVSSGNADILMKGLVDTSVVLRAVLDSEKGLRTDSILSHVAFFKIPGYDRPLLLTDAAMNIAPDLAAKARILRNAVAVAHALGIEEPKAAVICAKEKVDPKMPATLDAQALTEMNRNGEIDGCIVGGPFALDNAVSPEAAEHKGIIHPAAGCADILLVPDIETGNVLYKAMVIFARADVAGVLVGARAPVVITSRADCDAAKLNSIALAVILAKAGAEKSAGTGSLQR